MCAPSYVVMQCTTLLYRTTAYQDSFLSRVAAFGLYLRPQFLCMLANASLPPKTPGSDGSSLDSIRGALVK